MGQILLKDNLPNLVRDSSTQISMATTSMGQPTRITVGGQSYIPSSTLLLNPTTTTGAGGRDTGAIGANSLYYIYAIVNQTTFLLSLISSAVGPSVGPTMPTGYGAAYTLVGAWYSNGSSTVGSLVDGALGGVISTDWIVFTPTFTNYPSFTLDRALWRRVGEKLEALVFTTATGASTGDVRWEHFTNLGFSSRSDSSDNDLPTTGWCSLLTGSSPFANNNGYVSGWASGSKSFRFSGSTGSLGTSPTIANGNLFRFHAIFSVDGWKNTLL